MKCACGPTRSLASPPSPTLRAWRLGNTPKMTTPAATTAPATQLPSLSWLPWLLLAVIAGAGISPLLAGKREETLGKLQCEAQLSEARGKLGFLERSSETEAQRMRQLQQELAAVKQSEQQLRREAETRRDSTPEQTLPEQLRALMEVQHLLSNGPQARLRVNSAQKCRLPTSRPISHCPAALTWQQSTSAAAMPELLEGPAPQESSASAAPKCSSTAQVPHVLPVMLGGVAKWLLARGEGTQLPRGVDEVHLSCACS